MIVPGGGLSPDGSRWVACRPGFFLPVRVLSHLFRRLFLDRLTALREARRLVFFGEQARLADRDAFAAHIAPLRKAEWVVYAKRPFGGPGAVLAYTVLAVRSSSASSASASAFGTADVHAHADDSRYRFLALEQNAATMLGLVASSDARTQTASELSRGFAAPSEALKST